MNAANDFGELAAIPEEESAPSLKKDELSVQEEMDLSAGKRATYQHWQFVKFLKRELSAMKAEVKRMQPIEVDHARIKQAHRSNRFSSGLTAFFMILGSCLITSAPHLGGVVSFAVGWAVVLIAGFLQLGKSVGDL